MSEGKKGKGRIVRVLFVESFFAKRQGFTPAGSVVEVQP